MNEFSPDSLMLADSSKITFVKRQTWVSLASPKFHMLRRVPRNCNIRRPKHNPFPFKFEQSESAKAAHHNKVISTEETSHFPHTTYLTNQSQPSTTQPIDLWRPTSTRVSGDCSPKKVPDKQVATSTNWELTTLKDSVSVSSTVPKHNTLRPVRAFKT